MKNAAKDLGEWAPLAKAWRAERIEALVVLDDAGRVVRWDETAERLTGRAAAEALGSRWEELFGAPLPRSGATFSAGRRSSVVVTWGPIVDSSGARAVAVALTPGAEGGSLSSEARYRSFVDHATDPARSPRCSPTCRCRAWAATRSPARSGGASGRGAAGSPSWR